MKNTFKKILVCSSALLFMLSSCKKDETMAIATEGKPSALSASSQDVVLLEANATKEAVKFSWTKADYGYEAVVKYTLQADKKGNNFAKPASFVLTVPGGGNSYEQALTVLQFNTLLTDLQLEPTEVSEIELRVASQISTTIDAIYSSSIPMKVVTYAGKPKEMYLVGGSTSIGWSEAAALPFTLLGDGKFESYQYLTVVGDGFKILPTKGSWSGDMGMKDGSPGTLTEQNEKNIPVTADGYYRIYLEMTTISKGIYTLKPSSWGVIGDATPGSWDTDTNMTYDPASKTWKVTMNLTAGKQFKFRLNDEWTTNYGSTAASDGDTALSGSLSPGGKNFGVAAGGSYTITLDAINQTYSMVKN
ncbi:hypothetical protein D3C72_1101290 [compost metagenome]